ncbi:MAG: HEPN domain-containing protein [Prevotella sp.]|nr:HEPN domain-containing protein [Prevotella sp.]
MAREDIVQKWLEHVHEDISAAECLFQGGHWLYVAFLCHQAIEKALKAYYAATHDDDPRYTHSHSKLLEDCGLIDQLSDEQLGFLDLMVPMYIEARYPEQKDAAARMLNEEACQHIIKTTKELTQWIEERLPEKKPLTSSDTTSGS